MFDSYTQSSASSPTLKINAISADLSLAEGAKEGIRRAVVPFGGKMADTVFMCAGVSFCSICTLSYLLASPDDHIGLGIEL